MKDEQNAHIHTPSITHTRVTQIILVNFFNVGVL
jgi:hypothetical protein